MHFFKSPWFAPVFWKILSAIKLTARWRSPSWFAWRYFVKQNGWPVRSPRWISVLFYSISNVYLCDPILKTQHAPYWITTSLITRWEQLQCSTWRRCFHYTENIFLYNYYCSRQFTNRCHDDAIGNWLTGRACSIVKVMMEWACSLLHGDMCKSKFFYLKK